MTQRKFVFMKFEDSLFLHFSEFFGEGAPVEVQVVGEALAVEGDRKGVGAGFGRLFLKFLYAFWITCRLVRYTRQKK